MARAATVVVRPAWGWYNNEPLQVKARQKGRGGVLYFLDTEFNERPGLLELISLGIVSEDGRELYAEVPWQPSNSNEWVRKHVWPYLANQPVCHGGHWTLPQPNTPQSTVATAVLELVGSDRNPRFVGYYADYDWVVFCWLFGAMVNLPAHFPKFCWDLKQALDQFDLRIPAHIKNWDGKGDAVHHALRDAHTNKLAYEWALDQLSGQHRHLLVP